LGWSVSGALAIWVIFGNRIANGLTSPRTIGVRYLTKVLEQRGYGADNIPGSALEQLVDRQIQQAPPGTGGGSRAIKDYLGEQLPALAGRLVAWIDNDPALEANWRDMFSKAGVPQRSR
jgi:hypothetical protein